MTKFKILILFSFIGLNLTLFAQNTVNEYSEFECSHSKLVKFPVSDNQTTFYEHRDQFSFWYRLEPTEDGLITCNIRPLTTDDEYTLFVYQYNKFDFCNKVFYNKIKPLKLADFESSIINPKANLTQVRINAKQGDAYYVCVLNVSESNCGHQMQISNITDTFKIDAIHIPCKPEEITTTKPTIESTALTGNNLLKATVTVKDEYATTKNVDAQLIIKDELTGNSINIDFKTKNTFDLMIEKGKAYKVECLAMGYKRFNHSIVISDYLNDSLSFDVFLRPLKKGETFVMKSIYFYPNTYALKSKSKQEIDYLLNYLNNNPEVKIEISGHTNGDNKIHKNRAYKDKGEEWNFEGSSKKLSDYRAATIKAKLIEKGIDANRIETTGYGGAKMIIENAKTLEEIEQNVRVEVQIL
jgi:outer membrane protein OmpA-like peptidoglycan-associated protein